MIGIALHHILRWLYHWDRYITRVSPAPLTSLPNLLLLLLLLSTGWLFLFLNRNLICFCEIKYKNSLIFKIKIKIDGKRNTKKEWERNEREKFQTFNSPLSLLSLSLYIYIYIYIDHYIPWRATCNLTFISKRAVLFTCVFVFFFFMLITSFNLFSCAYFNNQGQVVIAAA